MGFFSIAKSVEIEVFISNSFIAASIVGPASHLYLICCCDVRYVGRSGHDRESSCSENNSARGYEVIDQKAALENVCAQTVSCADILTIAAEESVVLAGGPSWAVPLGRLDSRSANRSLANTALPGFNEHLTTSKPSLPPWGLIPVPTIRPSSVFYFEDRLYNFSGTGEQDPDLNERLAARLREICPPRLTNLTNLDQTTPDVFDNTYFKNLQVEEGLLRSDQILFSTQGADTVGIVNDFSSNQTTFFEAFVESMIRMGNIRPTAYVVGEVRLNCRVVNADITIAAADGRLVSSV
ncbi:Detected protein of unknown function [Hibiscus syriacus]|uniref:Peroxidase n=1 Tax=Hibiscus syriacus TaxID=106335 RepID=A0A6A2W9H3_HIBSY|nr:Detected protein of unknown function [Hibiscus syriacus]